MRLGSSIPVCVHVAVMLGVREGDGFRRHQPVMLVNVRSLTESPAAEIELDPGEYHIVGYSCIGQKGPTAVMDSAGSEPTCTARVTRASR